MFQRGKGETCILQRSIEKASTNIHVYMSVCMHSLLFTKTCETHQLPAIFSVLSSPQNQVYGRLASKNFRTLNIVYSLRTVKFCLEFLLFRFFCGHHFLAKHIIKQQKLQKLPYVRKIFLKLSQIFLPEIPKFYLF